MNLKKENDELEVQLKVYHNVIDKMKGYDNTDSENA